MTYSNFSDHLHFRLILFYDLSFCSLKGGDLLKNLPSPVSRLSNCKRGIIPCYDSLLEPLVPALLYSESGAKNSGDGQ